MGKFFEIFEKLTSDLAHFGNKISKKRKKWSCSSPLEIYINRREISRWFQKCITSYAYFAYLLRYVHFTVKKCRFRCRRLMYISRGFEQLHFIHFLEILFPKCARSEVNFSKILKILPKMHSLWPNTTFEMGLCNIWRKSAYCSNPNYTYY